MKNQFSDYSQTWYYFEFQIQKSWKSKKAGIRLFNENDSPLLKQRKFYIQSFNYHIQSVLILIQFNNLLMTQEMEAQQFSPQNQEQHYPFQLGVSHSDCLYKLRHKNDQILLETFRLHNQNEKIQANIMRQRLKVPDFVYNWWESNRSVQKMSVFLYQLNLALQEEINQTSRKIGEYKNECEINQVDYSEQLKQKVELQEKVQFLAQKLDNLKANSVNQAQIQNLIGETTGNKLRQHNLMLNMLKSAVEEKAHFEQRLKARFFQNSCQNKEQQYYAEFQFILSFLFQRKKAFKGKLEQIKKQIEHFDKSIQEQQQDREVKNDLKKSIMRKRQKLKALNEKLQQIQAQKQKIKLKKTQLQEKFSEEEMDKVVPKINRQSKRSQELLNRVVEMLKDIGSNSGIEKISNELEK